MASVPRRHHYTPRFYLEGFTDDQGRLHVVSREDGHRFGGTPESIGFERDFYKLDEVAEGEDSHAIERAFADFETTAAAVLREVIEARTVPTDPDKLNTLLNFVALADTRVPSRRRLINKPLEHAGRIVAELIVSTPERFEAMCAKAGIDRSRVTFESMKEFVEHNMIVHVPTAAYIDAIMTMIDAMLPCLAARNWSVLNADTSGEHFVVSDHPVALTWSDSRPYGFLGPGHAHLKTDVTMPLSSKVALLGRFEEVVPASNLSRQNVAAINAKTMAFCRRFIAGQSDSFICQDRDGAVVTDEDVIAHIKSDTANS